MVTDGTTPEKTVVSAREEYVENSMTALQEIQAEDTFAFPSVSGEFIFSINTEHLCAVDSKQGTIKDKVLIFPEDASISDIDASLSVTAFCVSPALHDSSIIGRRGSISDATTLSLICTTISDGSIRLYVHGPEGFALARDWIGTKRTSVRKIAFSQDGNSFVTCCADGSAKVWDIQSSTPLSTVPPRPGRITSACFMEMNFHEGEKAKSSVIALGSEVGEVSLWRTADEKCIQRINDSKHAIIALEFNSTLQKLICASADQTVFSYSPQKTDKTSENFQMVSHDKFLVKYPVSTVCFVSHAQVSESSGDEDDSDSGVDQEEPMAIVAFTNGIVSAYTLRAFLGPKVISTQQRIPKIASRSSMEMGNHCILHMQYCKEKRLLWSTTGTNMIYALALPTLDIHVCFVSSIDAALSISKVQIGHPKSTLLIANNTQTPILVQPGSNQCVSQLVGHTDTVLCVATAFDGKLIATGSRDRTLRLWMFDPSMAKFHMLHDGFRCVAATSCPEEINGLGFLQYASKTKVAVVNISTDDSLNVWKILIEKKRKRKIEESSPLLSHDNFLRTLKSGEVTLQKAINHTVNGIHVTVTKTSAGKSTQRAGGNAFALAVSHGEKFIATAGRDKTVCIYAWSSKGGLVHEATLSGHKKSVYSLLFHPQDSGLLASGAGDCAVKLWSLYSGACEQTFIGHTAAVVALEFMTQGLQLVSADTKGFIRIWRVHSGVCLTTLATSDDEKIWALQAIDDGQQIFSGSSSGVIRCWDDVTKERAEERAHARSERIENNIRLEECMHSKQYTEGIRRALQLRHPRFAFNFLRLFIADCLRVKAVPEEDNTDIEHTLEETDAPHSITELMRSLDDAAVLTLMQFCVDWVRVSSRSSIAQRCINAVFCTRDPNFLRQIESRDKDDASVHGSLIKTLQQFSTKYATRVQNMLQETYAMEYFEFVNSGASETLLSVE